ncbi:hypothetical protein WN982_40065 [Paraburkholderia sp. IMGN_8]|uniref:hypothetical protein n=1 Tax=Paraburkholderia sp. IMGN_8 TaxID=3136564 RepID=UPI003100CC8E
MTAAELIERLHTAHPDARVMFLPFGADEDGLEDVGVAEVFAMPWTLERCYHGGHVDEFLYSGKPDQAGADECGRVEYTSVRVVVLSVDEGFLRSRRYVRSPNDD